VEKLISDTVVETDTNDDAYKDVAKSINTFEDVDIELLSWMGVRIGKINAEVSRVNETVLLLSCNVWVNSMRSVDAVG
jgi:hypothetical protein